PVESIAEQDRGKMHRVGPEIAAFSTKDGYSFPLYTSRDMKGAPGMSGGPVCVLSTNSLGALALIPAAAYLGETYDDSLGLARIIDVDAVNLINSAEASALTIGTDHTGGGVILISYSATGSGVHKAGIVRVRVGPPSAVNLGGAWRVSPTNYGNY